jgi:hypothetical protein
MMSQIALTIDVEWAHPEVLADVVRELDLRSLRATFFCTHPGIVVEGHERALHPNYRRHGNTLLASHPEWLDLPSDLAYFHSLTRATFDFCPEAVGARSHNLFWDSGLALISAQLGLRYVSNAFLPLASHLQPAARLPQLTELPLYYMDHWDLTESATAYSLAGLRLHQPGLKILDFHPNLIFINARSNAQYLDSKRFYQDPQRLAAARAPGRGVRTLFLELLDHLAAQPDRPPLLREIESSWRLGERA